VSKRCGDVFVSLYHLTDLPQFHCFSTSVQVNWILPVLGHWRKCKPAGTMVKDAEGGQTMSKGRWIALSIVGLIAVFFLAYLLHYISGINSDYEAETTDGRLIFQQACASCHGVQGEGTFKGKPLAGLGLPVDYIKDAVTDGRGAKMPAFPGIHGEALEQLAQYVNQL
jgi:mono/diheme cytochrome c family protein